MGWWRTTYQYQMVIVINSTVVILNSCTIIITTRPNSKQDCLQTAVHVGQVTSSRDILKCNIYPSIRLFTLSSFTSLSHTVKTWEGGKRIIECQCNLNIYTGDTDRGCQTVAGLVRRWRISQGKTDTAKTPDTQRADTLLVQKRLYLVFIMTSLIPIQSHWSQQKQHGDAACSVCVCGCINAENPSRAMLDDSI